MIKIAATPRFSKILATFSVRERVESGEMIRQIWPIFLKNGDLT
jgi:hypothetical protein